MTGIAKNTIKRNLYDDFLLYLSFGSISKQSSAHHSLNSDILDDYYKCIIFLIFAVFYISWFTRFAFSRTFMIRPRPTNPYDSVLLNLPRDIGKLLEASNEWIHSQNKTKHNQPCMYFMGHIVPDYCTTRTKSSMPQFRHRIGNSAHRLNDAQ